MSWLCCTHGGSSCCPVLFKLVPRFSRVLVPFFLVVVLLSPSHCPLFSCRCPSVSCHCPFSSCHCRLVVFPLLSCPSFLLVFPPVVVYFSSSAQPTCSGNLLPLTGAFLCPLHPPLPVADPVSGAVLWADCFLHGHPPGGGQPCVTTAAVPEAVWRTIPLDRRLCPHSDTSAKWPSSHGAVARQHRPPVQHSLFAHT